MCGDCIRQFKASTMWRFNKPLYDAVCGLRRNPALRLATEMAGVISMKRGALAYNLVGWGALYSPGSRIEVRR